MKSSFCFPLLFCLCLAVGCGEKPTPTEKHMESGDRLRASRHYPDAAREYQAALKSDSKNVRAHLALAGLYRQELNDRRKAIEHLQAAVKLQPKETAAWEDLFAIYQAQRNNPQLARSLSEALKGGAFDGNAARKREVGLWLKELDEKLQEPPDGSIAIEEPSLQALPGD